MLLLKEIYDNLTYNLINYIDSFGTFNSAFIYKSFKPLSNFGLVYEYINYTGGNLNFLGFNNFKSNSLNYTVSTTLNYGFLDIILNNVYSDSNSYKYVVLENSSYTLGFKPLIMSVLVQLIKVYIFICLAVFTLFKLSFFKPLETFVNKVSLESEQNLFCFEDFTIIMGVYFVYIINFSSVYIPVASMHTLFFQAIKFTSMLLCILIAFLPTYFVWSAGIYVFYYIKGSSNDTNLVVGALNDFMGLLSTVLRYFVQSVRWVLFFLCYYALQLFFYEVKLSDSSNNAVNFFNTNSMATFSSFNSNSFMYLVYVMFRVWFELMDFFFVTLVQLSAFIVVLFWLLGFLFSTVLPNIFENSNFQNKI